MSELEKRETQFSSVLDRGESLKIGHHAASQVKQNQQSSSYFKLHSPYISLTYFSSVPNPSDLNNFPVSGSLSILGLDLDP